MLGRFVCGLNFKWACTEANKLRVLIRKTDYSRSKTRGKKSIQTNTHNYGKERSVTLGERFWRRLVCDVWLSSRLKKSVLVRSSGANCYKFQTTPRKKTLGKKPTHSIKRKSEQRHQILILIFELKDPKLWYFSEFSAKKLKFLVKVFLGRSKIFKLLLKTK